MSAGRRPLVVATVLALVTLVATTVTGAASAADVAPAAAAVAKPAAVAAPSGRLSSLMASSPSTAPLGATTAAVEAAAASRPPCAITARACVSLSAHKAWLTDGAGGIVYGPVGVLGGRRGEPTPIGTFSVTKKDANYHSRQFDAPMPYSVFFAAGIAFHTGSLGTRSAGCLHLSNASAKRFFATLQRGDEVQVLA